MDFVILFLTIILIVMSLNRLFDQITLYCLYSENIYLFTKKSNYLQKKSVIKMPMYNFLVEQNGYQQPEKEGIEDDETSEFGSSPARSELRSSLSGSKRSSPDGSRIENDRNKRSLHRNLSTEEIAAHALYNRDLSQRSENSSLEDNVSDYNHRRQNQHQMVPTRKQGRKNFSFKEVSNESNRQNQHQMVPTRNQRSDDLQVSNQMVPTLDNPSTTTALFATEPLSTSSISAHMDNPIMQRVKQSMDYAGFLQNMDAFDKARRIDQIEYAQYQNEMTSNYLTVEHNMAKYGSIRGAESIERGNIHVNLCGIPTLPAPTMNNSSVMGGSFEHFAANRLYDDGTYQVKNGPFQQINDTNFLLIKEHFSPDTQPYYIKNSKDPKNLVFNIYNLFKQIVLWANDANENRMYTPEDLLLYPELFDREKDVSLDNRKPGGGTNSKDTDKYTDEYRFYINQPIHYNKIIRKENSFVRNMYLLFYHLLHSYAFYVLEGGNEEIFSEGGQFCNRTYRKYKDVSEHFQKQRIKKLDELKTHFKNRGEIFKPLILSPKKKENNQDAEVPNLTIFSVNHVKRHFENEDLLFNEKNVIDYLKRNNYNPVYRLQILSRKSLSSNLWSVLSKFALEMTCYIQGLYKQDLHNANKITAGQGKGQLSELFFSDEVTEYDYVQAGSTDEKDNKDSRKNRIRSVTELLTLLNLRRSLQFNNDNSLNADKDLGMSNVLNLVGLKRRK